MEHAPQGASGSPSQTGDFWVTKRVLVTGATGFVGSYITRRLLHRGAYVVALVRDVDYRSEFYRSGIHRQVAAVHGELENLSAILRSINEHEVDTVIHLGAQTVVESAERFPLQTFESNIRGTYNLLEACRLAGGLIRRIVVASSDKAYGDHHGVPYEETAPLLPKHPYEVSKTCSDLLAQTYAYTYGTPVAVVRCGNVYGGGDLNWSRLVPGTIRSLIHDQQPVIRSDGTYVRDYMYAEDAAAAYLLLAERLDDERLRGEAFNFSNENPMSVSVLVGRITELMEKRHLQPIIEARARNEIQSQILSARKARSILGWSPEYDLDDGMSETIAWYRAFFGQDANR